jgi:hypothetical protein
MMMRHRYRLPLLAGTGMAAIAGLAIALWPAAGPAGRATVGVTLAQGEALPITCMMGEQPFGYAGVARASQAAGARLALGSAFLTQVRDSANGSTLDLARSPNDMNSSQRSLHFSQWLPVYPQAKQSRLQSCDMTLGNRPAAQPLITAAITSFVKAGYFTSAADARSREQEVLVSDNPTAAGSVIMTFMITGRVYTPAWPKGMKLGSRPPVHRLDSYTAIETIAGHRVTGIARGGL